ncbi:ABC transporter permease subunit [Paenibacillus sp. TRM 82003]|nr:ABC transporter permease subunit [Paenibacillus sp. TRM 82003]
MNRRRSAALGERILPFLVWSVGGLAIWQATSWYLTTKVGAPLAQSKLPYLHKVLEAFATYGATLLKEGGVTLANAGVGFALGAASGAALAIWMSASKRIEALTFPYAVASQMVPILGIAPIVYGIVRDESTARILIAGYITFFPVALNTLRGLRSVPPASLDLMSAYAASPLETYWKLRLPAALPGMFAGLKIAAPLAVTGAILVELMGAQHGIGVLMLRNLYYGPSHTYLFWSTVVSGALLGVLSYMLMSAAERYLSPWQPQFRSGGGER